MKKLTDRLDQLSPEKRALLQSMLLKKSGKIPEKQGIPRRTRANHVALSFAQGRLWFLERLAPDQVLYNLSSALRLLGRLDLPILERCLNEIIRRHEILRTTFTEENGEPVQIIASSRPTEIHRIDLSGLAEAEKKSRVRRLAAEAARRPFDLEKGPLLRLDLLRMEETEHVLVMTMHHMVSDGWSMGVMIREIRSLYESFYTGTPSPLPELDIQYADFALWQREWMKGPEPAAQVDYWTEKLAGAPPVLNLPLDRPRPPRQTHNGAVESVDIEPGLTRALDDLARSAGATRFMILFAAYTVLLYRYSNQEDILAGTPVAGRNHREIEPLIGFFVNTLVLRTDLSGDPLFTELLDQVRRTSVEAFAHQDLPFEKLVDALQPERTLSHSPVFQTMFVMHNAHGEALELPGLTIRPMEAEIASVQFDLILSVLEVDSGLHMRFEYNTDLFDAETIRRMADNFHVLLSGIADQPERKVSELPLLTEWERHRLLVEFNDTAEEYPADKTIVDLFEAQVERTPEAPAVIFEDHRLSYRELNQAANRVAHFLMQKCGVRPEDRIGVFLERSQWPTVAMLGIMKAGCAYLPLDPAYPEDRLRYMIEDSGCAVILTEPGTRDDLLDVENSARLINIHEPMESGVDNPGQDLRPSHLAYVIYTSGSTGRPKGVMVEHGGFVNMALSQIHLFKLGGKDRILQFSSSSFDASMYETFITLLSGAGLVCVRKTDIGDPEKLVRIIRKQSVTTAVIPPSYLQVLGFDRLRDLKTLITAGESALPDEGNYADAEHHYWNAYGPTETSVCATCFPVPTNGYTRPQIPIGRPIRNTRILILNPSGEHLQPIGAPGEICIAGVGLARGYLNRPKMTAEKFASHPFKPGERIYRTGDLGLWLPDGDIEFLGRIDDQVKIRGYRIELGEIENAIAGHPAVKGAVVLAKSTGSRSSELIAYVTLKTETSIDVLRDYLHRSLPDFMVPARFLKMQKFPLTPNGKVNKKGLPDPDEKQMASGDTYLPPTNEHEAALVSVLSDVLGRNRVGIHDNYFGLGGDSLKAIQVASRLRQQGLKMEIQDLFKYPTPAQLASRLSPCIEETESPDDLSNPVPLTPVQSWFWEEITTDRHHFNQAILLSGAPRFEKKALESALNTIWTHHDALRLVFRQNGNQVTSEYKELFLPFPLEIVDIQGKAGGMTEMEAHIVSVQSGMDLENGPLMKAVLYRLDDSDRLLMVAHHLVVDAFSFRILLEDLGLAYERSAAAKPVALPPKTASFKAWSQRIHEYASEDALAQETDYWRRIASIPRKPLPSDLKNGRNLEQDGGSLSVFLTPSETEALLTRIESGRIEVFLLTALAIAAKEWTGEREHVVLLAGHGRESDLIGADVSRTVGWFSAMYPIRLDLSGSPDSFLDSSSNSNDECNQIKAIEKEWEKIPNRGIGYSLLRFIRKDPVLTASPWPEIVFNYVGQVDRDLKNKWFSLALESSGPLRAPMQKRPHVIEMSALVLGGCFMVTLLYDGSRFAQSTINEFLGNYQKALQNLIKNCLPPS